VAGDRAVLYFGEPIHSRYVLVRRDHLATVTSLAHERWKRAHPRGLPTEGAGGNRNEAVQPTAFTGSSSVGRDLFSASNVAASLFRHVGTNATSALTKVGVHGP